MITPISPIARARGRTLVKYAPDFQPRPMSRFNLFDRLILVTEFLGEGVNATSFGEAGYRRRSRKHRIECFEAFKGSYSSGGVEDSGNELQTVD